MLRAFQGERNYLKGVFGMPKIDIGNIERMGDLRGIFVEVLYDEKLSEGAHIVAWAFQRLVDLDLPLTISTISDATNLDPFFIKEKIDELEYRYFFKWREYDEITGKYRLIRR